MPLRPRSLSLENLESRLNLSTLGGLSVPPTATAFNAQEKAILNKYKVISLSDYLQATTPVPGATLSATSPASIKAPVKLTAIAGSGNITLRWTNKAANQHGVQLYRSTDGQNFTELAILSRGKNSYIDRSAAMGVTYFYAVAAFDSTAQSSLSNVALGARPVPVTAPLAPSNFSAAPVSSNSISLSWTDNATNATGYNVYRSTNGNTFTQITSLASTATAFTDTGLKAKTKYTYKVAAWNSAKTVYAQPVTATTLAQNTALAVAPSAPANITFSNVTTSSLSVNWAAPGGGGQTGFHVYRSTDGVTYTQIADLAATATSFGDTGLSAGTTYYYQIAAYNTIGETAAAPVSQATSMPLVVAPTAPTNLAFSNVADTGLTLSWSDVNTNESGVRVYRSTDGVNFTAVASLAAGTTTFSDSGLSATTTYYYQVSSWNSAGETRSTAAAQATATTPISAPTAPTNLAFSNVTSGGLTLNWTDANTGESGVRVYRSTDGVNYSAVASLAAGSTAFNDSGLSASTTYYYQVSSWNSAGETYSVAVERTTAAPPVVAPVAPWGLNASNITTSSVMLSWVNSTGASGYNIYRSTDGVNFALVGNAAAGGTLYTDTGLSAGVTYTYKVSAWNSGGETFAAPVSATTQAIVVAPTAPTNLSFASVTSTGLTLSWQDGNTSESGLRVYRSTDGVNFAQVASLSVGTTSFSDSGLSASTTYYYKVSSWNSAGETLSTAASSTTAAPPVVAPAAPGALAFSSVTSTGLTVSWTDNSINESGFRVYRSTDGVNFTQVAALAPNTTSYADSGLSASTAYYYKVSSWNSAGETLSTAASATTAAPPVVAPAAPSALAFSSVTASSLTLSWTDNSANESGFRVYRSTDGVNFTQVAALAPNTTSYADSGLSPSTTYYYKVSSWNSAGETLSTASSTTTNAVAPAAPSALAFSNVTAGSLSLSWTDNSSNATGIRVYRSTDGVTFTQVAALAANATSYADSGLAAATTYYYKVSAYNTAGETLSSAASTTTSAVAPAAPGTLTFSSVTASSLTLAWKDNSNNESGFRIYRSTDGVNFTQIASVATNATSYADSGLTASTIYYYKVSSYNSAGETLSAVASTTTSAVAPAAPSTPTFSSVTTSGLTLSWTSNSSNASGFHVYRSTDGVNFTQIAAVSASTTTYADSGLSASTKYYYNVSSWNSAGETLSVAASTTTNTAAPAAPWGLNTSNITTSSVMLSWVNSTGASGYRIYRSTDGVNFTQVGTAAAGGTLYTDSGLASGTTYTYKVSAWNSGGETFAAPVTATTQSVVAAPTAPANLIFSAVTSSGLTLTWTDSNSTESGVRVYRSTDGVNFSQVAALAAGTTSYADSNLSASTTYYYKVSAYNAGGETLSSAASQTTSAPPVSVPVAPANLAFSSVTSSGLTLSWSDSNTVESGVRVYRSTDGVNFSQIASLSAGTSTYADSGLAASTTYYYKVSSYNSAGETLSSAASTTTAAQAVSPVAITTRNMTSFTELDITGTSGNDSIVVSQSNGILTIVADGVTTTVNNTFGNIVIHGGNGNDTITVQSSVNIATLIYGGDGSDTIKNLTTGKATIVTIGNGTNTVTGNGINTSYWVNPNDVVNASSAEIALNAVNRVTSWYQPFTTNPAASNYIPRGLYGQTLPEPTDAGSVKFLTANSFWGTGPIASDINQGSLGDCYFMAPLASLANNEPQRLMNMGVDLGDGTYAIRFIRNGVTSFVRVDGALQTGGFAWGVNNNAPGADGNLWGSIFEKAYAFYRSGANTYASLNYGFQSTSFNDLGLSTGMASAAGGATATLNLINSMISSGKSLAVNTNSSIVGGAPIVASHVYSIFGAYTDASGNVWIQLRNPWGVDGFNDDSNPSDGLVTISYTQFAANFGTIAYTTV